MTTLIDIKRSFDKVQLPNMTKVLKELGKRNIMIFKKVTRSLVVAAHTLLITEAGRYL